MQIRWGYFTSGTIFSRTLESFATKTMPIFDESKLFLLETSVEGGLGVVGKVYDQTKNEVIAFKKLPILNMSHFFRLERLGQGGFGLVQKYYDSIMHEFMALKQFKNKEGYSERKKGEAIMLENGFLQLVEEIRRSQKKYHKYFLKYHGVFKSGKDSDDLYLLMENGRATLEDILKAGKIYSCEELIFVVREIVQAFVILEENGIANRDVKAGNIILKEKKDNENAFDYKITDFGIACKLEEGIDAVEAETISGITEEYAAPEVQRLFKMGGIFQNHEVYNPFRADVFSLGITVLKMINNKFRRKNLDLLLQQKLKLPGYEEISQLLEGMVEENPSNRWTFKRILKYLDQKRDLSKCPTDEWDYIEKWLIEIRDKKMENTYEDLQKLFQEHETICFAYRYNVQRPKVVEFHLNRCKDILEKIKNIMGENGSLEQKCDLLEKKIRNFKNFGDLFMAMRDFKSSDENFYAAIVKIEEFRDEFEQDLTKKEKNKIDELYRDIFNSFTILYRKMNEFPKSTKKSMKIKKDLFAKNQFDLAPTLKNIGSSCKDIDDLQKGEKYYLIYLEIYENLFGKNNSAFARRLNKLGNFYELHKKYVKAKKCYRKSLKIYQDLFGECNFHVAKSLKKLGSIYYKMDDLKAKKYYLKSLNILLYLFGEKSLHVAKCRNVIHWENMKKAFNNLN